MSADPVIYCLEQLTDYRQFERLCSDLMDGCGYANIDPLGGSADGGRDALYYRAGKEPTVFAYTVRIDWRRKLLQDCERIREEGHNASSLVYVCTSTLTATQKDEIRAQVLTTFGWCLDIYDLERIRVLLTGSLRHLIQHHPAIFCPPWFPQRNGFWTRWRIYLTASFVVLAVGGFLALWAQNHYHDKRLSAQLSELVENSRAPEKVRGSVDALQNQNIPREAIVSSLVILGARPDIPVSEIPSFFENFAAAYLKSKSIDGAVYASDQARAARKRAQANVDKGDFEAAEEALEASVSTLEKHLEQNREDLIQMYEDLAHVLAMKAEYKQASEFWQKAGALIKGSPRAATTYKMLAWQALLAHSTLFVDKAVLRETIQQGKSLAAEMESVGEVVGARWVRSLNVSAMRQLAKFESNDAILEEAEASFDDVVRGCDERNPSIDCYLAFSSFSSLYSERGTRSLLTKEGRAQQESRLLLALQAAKLAKVHAEATGNESSRVNANLDYALAEMHYADHVGDTKLEGSGGNTIFAKFNELYQQILQGDYPEVLDTACVAVMIDGASVDDATVARIVEAETRSIQRGPGGKSYLWAQRQSRLGQILRRFWQRRNDVSKLEQAVREFEKAFEFIDEKLPMMLAAKQIDFAILLSDYGWERKSVPHLERAILTFKTAADNFYKLNSPFDRRVALRNMSISLGRLQAIGGKACWKEIQKRVNAESSMIEQLLERAVYVPTDRLSQSGGQAVRYDELLRQQNGLAKMMRSLDAESSSCLPALRENPSLRRIA